VEAFLATPPTTLPPTELPTLTPFEPGPEDTIPPTTHMPESLLDPMDSVPCDEDTEYFVTREIMRNLAIPEVDFRTIKEAPPTADNQALSAAFKQLTDLLELIQLDPATPARPSNPAPAKAVKQAREQYVQALRTHAPNLPETLAAYQTTLSAYQPSREELHYSLESFKTAATSISRAPFLITSGAQVASGAQKLAGVGASTALRIDEFLLTHTLQELGRSSSPRAISAQSLMQIHGIGPKKAWHFMDRYGVTSAEDLIARYRSGEIKPETNGLTTAMVNYIAYYEDLQTRIPYSEIREINHILQQVIRHLDPRLSGIICGSHRRLQPHSGDIDMLLVHPDLPNEAAVMRSHLFPQLISILTKLGYLLADLNESRTDKYFGIFRLSPTHRARRIDLLFIGRESFPAALCYFTGSGTFNQMVRSRALALNYTLNEYGLYHYKDGLKGQPIPLHCEMDIFRILRIKLDTVAPPQREFGKLGRPAPPT